MDTMHARAPGAKSDFAPDPPIGFTGPMPLVALTRMHLAALEFNLRHPGPNNTRAEASLCAGAQAIAAEALGFGFEDASVFEHHCGWGTTVSYREGIDFSEPGMHFTDMDLRCEVYLRLSSSAALALFHGRDLIAGNPDLIGIACMIQRRAVALDLDFRAVLVDAMTAVAKVLTFHRPEIEAAAAFVERDGAITRDTRGMSKLLAAARATPIPAMPPAPEQARKLLGQFYSARMDLGVLAREVSQLAMSATAEDAP